MARSYPELRAQMQARMLKLQASFDAGADLLLEKGDLARALGVLTPVCRPHGLLDPMRCHAVAGHFYAHPRLAAIRNGLHGAVLPDSQPIADALLYLGELQAAEAMYRRLSDLNSVAVVYDLLDRHDLAEETWTGLLAGWESRPLDLLPIRYNLALSLCMQMQLPAATQEFKTCRAVYPHYRDTLFWVDWMRVQPWRSGPRSGPDNLADAVALPIPRYTKVVAIGNRKKT